jgi:pimeloyl-ACP methyl ester carboxylesterase
MAYVRTRLGRWFYEERGATKRKGDATIVLLHSLLCDAGMWKHQIEPLAALGRVVMFDGPGHGKSTELPPPFSLEDHADAMMDAFSELSIDRAVLVGLSWGGMLSMRIAIQHPKRAAALALLDTSADAELPKNVVKYRLFNSFARRFGLPTWFVDRQLAPLFFSDETIRERPELIERFARHTNGFSREGMARAAKAVVIKRVSILDKLSRIDAPTLVMCGRGDRATPPHRAEEITRGIRGAKLVWIERAGHLSALEEPDQVNAALVPFVRENLSR